MQSNQRGAVLIVSLILLLITTMAGISAISMAILEEKLARNYRDQQIAFQTAEAALVEAESFILKTELTESHSLNGCQGDFCFTDQCTQGLCRTTEQDKEDNCLLTHDQPWQEASIWEDSRYHRQTAWSVIAPQPQARYIIEFRCFVSGNSKSTPEKTTTTEDESKGLPLYRITALATGGTDSARIMLQSTLARPETSTPAGELNNQELFYLRAQQRRSWQQLEINF